jgi:ATP-binding cassette subfamily F protein uup
LSGGEQNRAILAKLFSKPANLLVLDEPTNDLDVETLELLEEILLDFKGTVLLVSHDREFMDNVVTSILVLDGKGNVAEHVGGYSNWADRGGKLYISDDEAEKEVSGTAQPALASTSESAPVSPQKKLSYKDQRQLDALPELIEGLEQQQSDLAAEISAPEFYQQDHSVTSGKLAQLDEINAKLEAAYAKWEEFSD